MAEYGLFQTQSQKLSIGPQMQQSLQILQAASLELRQVIQQEIATNPVLEVETPEVSLQDAVPDDPDGDPEQADASQMDEEWRDYWSQSHTATPRRDDDEERYRYMMESITVAATLQEHLLAQLRTATPPSAEVRELVEFLIGSLDDKGFLSTSIDDMSLQHAIPIEGLEQAKAILTTFDPTGVGATDLRECLLLQMERLGKKQSLPHRLVEQHMDDLAGKRFTIMAKKLAVPVEQISRAAEFISTLDPRPASRFIAMANHYVSPDIIIERQGGAWVAVMTNEGLPQLRISNEYKDMLVQPQANAEAREYIRDKIRSGKFLIRSIQQRQNTILRIATEIIKHQGEFLDKGPSFLRPLTMAQVATVIEVHETTVSRAISGKYLATPRGVLEMRYFFTQGLQTESGEDLSNTSVMKSIGEIIAGETHRKPLSDDKITKILNERGIHVARRTVAKYREALHILPSHLRKSFS